MSASTTLAWFQLFDSDTGQPYKNTTPTKVSLSSSDVIDDFRDAVKAKNPSVLTGVDSSQLHVYKNKSAFDKRNAAVDEDKEQSLDPTQSLKLLGSKDDMLVVAVPSSTSYVQELPRPVPGDDLLDIDCIDIQMEHLERIELVNRLVELVNRFRFVRLTSPSASGKSSLLMLYKCRIQEQADVVWISCNNKDRSFSQLLKDKAGIDLFNQSVAYVQPGRKFIVFLDDAQTKYNDKEFWFDLIKNTPTWIPRNVRFVISSTHLLDGGLDSPVELKSLRRLERNDFLLTPEQSRFFLLLPITGLPKSMQFSSLIQFLINECNGLIGALRLSIDSLKCIFRNDQAPPSEAALLQYCLSNDYVQEMGRCFGSTHLPLIKEEFRLFLIKVFLNEDVLPPSIIIEGDKESFLNLKKFGILVDCHDNATCMFTSHLAKRYYFKWLFPGRSMTAPTSLHELVQNVIGSMSSSVLKQSTIDSQDFPKEAVFQHLFLNGLARFTRPCCSICPELSKIFSGTSSGVSGTVPGAIDFFINGSHYWGIELLVNGDNIGEHLSRFASNGKYSQLGLKDYVVIDFRRSKSGKPTRVNKHTNRITVFFKQDSFNSAQCIFGIGKAVHINLAT